MKQSEIHWLYTEVNQQRSLLYQKNIYMPLVAQPTMEIHVHTVTVEHHERQQMSTDVVII